MINGVQRERRAGKNLKVAASQHGHLANTQLCSTLIKKTSQSSFCGGLCSIIYYIIFLAFLVFELSGVLSYSHYNIDSAESKELAHYNLDPEPWPLNNNASSCDDCEHVKLKHVNRIIKETEIYV